MSRVIAAINASLAARPALAMAQAIAPLFGAVVEAVHVAEGAERTVKSEAEKAGVTLRLLKGDPLEEIVATAAEDDVVALVIGAHSHGVSRHAGHLPLQLASTTDKPVIVVDPSSRPPERLRRVLVAMEGTAARAKTLKRALELIEASGLEVVVVHVDDESSIPSFNDQVQHETDAYVQEFFARFLPGVSNAHVELRIGVATDEILAATEQTGAELLAIGWPQTDQDGRGQVARELLERSVIPVLLVATV